MKPQESLNSNERIPQTSTEAMPLFDASADYNGMYASETEFKAAEAAYKIEPTVDLNTISFQEDNPAYPVATMEDVAAMDDTIDVSTETVPDSETSVELTEVVETTPETATSLSTEGAFDDKDVIDVEAKEVIVDPESLDDTEDIGELIANNEEITVGNEKLTLTTKLKNIAGGVLSSLDHLLESEPELPEEIDWRHYIMAEPDYDESYDYLLLQKLLNAQYKRKRAKLGAGKLLERMTASIPSVEGPAVATGGGAPPEAPPGAVAETTPQNPEAENEANGEILKIEMDKPETTAETPQLEYEGAVPALTYEPGANEESQGQPGQKRITQQ